MERNCLEYSENIPIYQFLCNRQLLTSDVYLVFVYISILAPKVNYTFSTARNVTLFDSEKRPDFIINWCYVYVLVC